MWRIIKIAFVLYILANLIGAYIFWPRIDQFIRFMPRVEAPAYAAPTSEVEAQKQDLSYLRTLLKYDRSFSIPAQTAFNAQIDALISEGQALSSAEFYLALRELVALADNAHTGVEASPAFRDFNRSGVDLYPFADGVYVVRAHKDNADLLGKKVIKVEGRPIGEVIKALRLYTGGAENWRDIQSLFFLRSPELLQAAGLAANADGLTLTFLDADGESQDVTLSAQPSAAETDYYFRQAFRTLSPEPLPDEGGEWVQIINQDSQDIAHYLTDISEVHLTKKIEGGLYVRSNYLLSSKEDPVKEQLLSSLEAAPANGYDFIAVDLRWNPGGDYGNTVPFAKRAAQATAEDGKIYVIVGPNTFSAAIVFSALLKQYAPNKTLIIGEPMGDRPQFWSERWKPFVLPNSDYWINYSTGYHDWEKGCADTHEYCFPPNKKHDADIGPLTLDKFLQPSFEDYKSGRDIVMDWVLKDNEASPKIPAQ